MVNQGQIENIFNFCYINEIKIEKIYSDISSGINLDRNDFSELLNLVFECKINTIYVNNKDRLTRLSFINIESIFKHFGTKIVVINEQYENYHNELFNEIISMMHYFSTKEYSNRRKHKII